jgi:putative hydrolase of the HAD superfamily
VFDDFDKLFLSYLTGNAKPGAASFQDVVAHFACAPGDIVFFDDNAGNVAAAREQGLHAMQVSGWQAAARAVAEFT